MIKISKNQAEKYLLINYIEKLKSNLNISKIVLSRNNKSISINRNSANIFLNNHNYSICNNLKQQNSLKLLTQSINLTKDAEYIKRPKTKEKEINVLSKEASNLYKINLNKANNEFLLEPNLSTKKKLNVNCMETEANENNKFLNLPNILETCKKPTYDLEKKRKGNEKSNRKQSIERNYELTKEIEAFDNEENKKLQNKNMPAFKKQDEVINDNDETEGSLLSNNNTKIIELVEIFNNNTKIGCDSSLSYNNNYYSGESQILTKNFEANKSLKNFYAKVRYLSRKNLRKRRNVSKMILSKLNTCKKHSSDFLEGLKIETDHEDEEKKIKFDSYSKDASRKLAVKLLGINDDKTIYQKSQSSKNIKSIEKFKPSQTFKKISNKNQHMSYVYANSEMPLNENLDLTKNFKNNEIFIFDDDTILLNRRNLKSINNSGMNSASRNSNDYNSNRKEKKEKFKTKYNSKHENLILNTDLNNEINSLVKNCSANSAPVNSTVESQKKTTDDHKNLEKNEYYNNNQLSTNQFVLKNLYFLNSKQIETQSKIFNRKNVSDMRENRKSTSPYKKNNLVFDQAMNNNCLNIGNLTNMSQGSRSLASSKSQYRNSNITGLRHRNRVASLRSKSKLEAIKVDGLGIDHQNLGSDSNSNSDASLNRKSSPQKTKFSVQREKLNRLDSIESIKIKGEQTNSEQEIECLMNELVNDSLRLPELKQRRGLKNIEYENLLPDTSPKKHTIPSAIQSRKGNSYIIAKVTKYSRQKSLNLFKSLQKKTFQENNHSKMGIHSSLNQNQDSKNENELPKKKPTPILVRGSTLITRELSQQAIYQHQKLKEISNDIKQSNTKHFSNNINKVNNYKKNLETENSETLIKKSDINFDFTFDDEKFEGEDVSVEIEEFEPTMNKAQYLYTFTATSSSQLKDPLFVLNRSLTNLNLSNINVTNSINSNNQIKYNRSDSASSEIQTKDSSLTVKNNSTNRQIFKDLEFIHHERQVTKLQRQILLETQNKCNSNYSLNTINNNINNYLENNLTKPNLVENSLNNNDYKFFERSKTTLLLDSLQPRLEFYVASYDDPNESSSGENNLEINIEYNNGINKNIECDNEIKNNIIWGNSITS